MKIVKCLIGGIIAGALISIGGCALLACENKLLGAFLFTLGLLTICSFGFNLFTGKVGYLLEQKPRYLIDLLVMLIGNFIGTVIIGLLVRLTRLTNIIEGAEKLMAIKNNNDPLSILVLGILCGVMVYIAVAGYKKAEHPFTKALVVIMAIMTFIIAGFEHSIADMFYMVAGNVWSVTSLITLTLVVFGNSIGALLCNILLYLFKKEEKNNA